MKKHAEYLIFAGTSEGRKLAEFLQEHQICAEVCVATEYGEKLLAATDYIQVHTGRMTEPEMENYIQERSGAPFQAVIDATHPHAAEVTKNIRTACENTGMRYVRLLRGQIDLSAFSDLVTFPDCESAAEWLEMQNGRIFLTTGMKELPMVAERISDRERLYARVLPQPEIFPLAEELGLSKKQLICMQGPFSVEMNYAIMKSYDISYMVTKDSGNIGGFLQKYNAAKKAGVKIIVLGRQKEESGYTYEEIIDLLKEEYHFKTMQKVTLAGIGMGTEGSMTVEVKKACEEADVLIGASRMLKSVVKEGQQTFAAYKPEEITDYIFSHPQDENIVVVLSGDPGFYSGAKKLILTIRDRLKKSGEPDRVKTEILPGISTVSSLCAKLQIPWEDIKLVSMHGREENLLAAVKNNK